MKEANEYILGTEREELWRLGLQHQVWSTEARRGWENGKFNSGDVILDLGAGPGYTSIELGYMVGRNGKIVALDKSEGYLAFLEEINELYGLNIETVVEDFYMMDLGPYNFDGVYNRWSLGWLSNVNTVVDLVSNAMKTGSRWVSHEYFDWSTLRTYPSFPYLDLCIKGALASFKEGEFDIDIGRGLPQIFEDYHLEVQSIRPMNKTFRPDELGWHWPKSFFKIYFPKLVNMDLISEETCRLGLEEFQVLEESVGAAIQCPAMVEVVGRKK